MFLMDKEFENIKDDVDTVTVNTTGIWKHIGKIEHGIWALKEHC